MKKNHFLLCLILFTFLISITTKGETPKINDVSFDSFLLKNIEKLSAEEELRVIVTFSDAKAAERGRTMLVECGAELIGPEFRAIPIQGVLANAEEIVDFTEIDGVIGIWQDRKLQNDLHQAVIVSSVHDVWTDNSFTVMNDGVAIEGNGVGVLVNDSGFDGIDTDIEAGVRLVQNVKGLGIGEWLEDSGDDNDQGGGHGSHCMGIVGGDGSRSGGRFKGVAPKAQLIGYGSGAGLFILDTGGGFEYVAQHGRDYNIRVMSNSFGTTADTTFTSFDPTHPTNVATKTLTDLGVIVVFSAGNSGPDNGKITGVYKTAPWVITVGNGTKDGGLASSSSRGRPDPNGVHPSMRADITFNGTNYLWENRPTVTAPGSDIVSVRASAGVTQATGVLGDLDANLSPTEVPYYNVLSGTSMACPHVAGIVALMLEANPNLEYRAVKAILQRTAISSMPGLIHERGAGYVNAHAAVAAAFNGLCDVPEGASYEELFGLNADGSFGFDSDFWKACPLNAEVAARLKASVPSPSGIEAACAVGTSPLTDAELDGTSPAKDIIEVTFDNETASTFDVHMKVSSNLAAAPLSVDGVETHWWDVHFVLDKVISDNDQDQADPPIPYILSSYRDASGDHFILTVKSGETNTRPSRNPLYRDIITGNWDETTNTITWTVPKILMNYTEVPPSSGATSMGQRNGRSAQAGDELGRWKAFTYTRPGTTTPDGAGVYDDAAQGSCYTSLLVD